MERTPTSSPAPLNQLDWSAEAKQTQVEHSALKMGVVVGSMLFAAAAGAVGYYMGLQKGQQSGGVVSPQPTSIATASPSTFPGGVACTMEAKICPDGSSVGRTGPHCEFAPCPGEGQTTVDTSTWQLVTSQKGGYSLRIPKTWKVDKTENDSLLAGQDYAVNMTLSSEKGGEGQAQFINAITVPFPFVINAKHQDMGKKFEQGLAGLYMQNESNVMIKSSTSEYATIGGYKALVQKVVNLDNEADLTESPGEYCLGCTTKTVYIDLGNGKIVEFAGSWEKGFPEFEATFDQIMQTFVKNK